MAEKKAKATKAKTETKKKSEKKEKKLFSRQAKPSAAGEAKISDYAVLRSPVITEKSSLAGSQSSSGPGSTLVFRVDPRSTKDDIRAAIERVFQVNVVKVRTANYIGKIKRTTRSSGRRAGFKKAYVTLKEGQTISIVEGL